MNHKVNILHVTCTHNPDDDRIFYRECLTLSDLHRPVMVMGVGNEDKEDLYHDIRIRTFSDEGYKENIRKIMHEARLYRPKLIHVHDLFILKESLRYAEDLNIPLIYDVHEHFPLLVRSYLPGTWLKKEIHRLVLEIRERRWSRKANHIITVVPQLTDRFSRWHKHVTEIRNYPRKALFGPETHKRIPPQLDKMLHFVAGRIIVIYAGNISVHRNLKLLADTVSVLNRKGFDCVGITLGSGEEGDEEQWDNVCRKSNGELLHLGYIPHEELPFFLREAHIGWSVLPEISPFIMSLPNKIFEYLACGLLIVATNISNIRHLFWKSPVAILVHEEDAEGIASMIRSAFPEKEQLSELKKLAQETFLNRFTWEREESKLLDVYQSVLKTDSDV